MYFITYMLVHQKQESQSSMSSCSFYVSSAKRRYKIMRRLGKLLLSSQRNTHHVTNGNPILYLSNNFNLNLINLNNNCRTEEMVGTVIYVVGNPSQKSRYDLYFLFVSHPNLCAYSFSLSVL